MKTKIISAFLALTFLTTSCTITIQTATTATAAPVIITSTLQPTFTPLPSETPLPPPPPPTAVAVEGTASTQVNVRAEPSTASQVLGVLPVNTKVQIIGKDPGGNWWQIVYSAGVVGKGWVTAKYVKTADSSQVPVIGGAANPNNGNSAVVLQQLNIRSGPGTGFNSLGILNANDIVMLTGKNRDGSWLQIIFAAGPDGKGWVNAGFVKTDSAGSLPIVSDSGNVLGTGTPMNTPLPPTPTIVPAPMDFDSAESPIKTVILEGAGAGTILYNGDVSAPDGDVEDWIAVTPDSNYVFLGIQCSGGATVQAGIVDSTISLVCNDMIRLFPVVRGASFLIHIRAVSSSNQLQYAKYTLTIKASP